MQIVLLSDNDLLGSLYVMCITIVFLFLLFSAFRQVWGSIVAIHV